jgi:hypothetical protein
MKICRYPALFAPSSLAVTACSQESATSDDDCVVSRSRQSGLHPDSVPPFRLITARKSRDNGAGSVMPWLRWLANRSLANRPITPGPFGTGRASPDPPSI